LKRLRQDNEMDIKLIQVKRHRSSYTREQDIGSVAFIKLKYNFIYKIVEVNSPRSRRDTFTPLSTSATLPSSNFTRSFISLEDSN
jgi:hypothetical protein